MEAQVTPYELMGGAETVGRLVEAFYRRVGAHPDLAPIFPPDLTHTAEKQYKFLTQFFGGPALYSQDHGAPMLRARHQPFPITPGRARAWLACMQGAMDEVGLDGPVREFMWMRLQQTAAHMVNTPE